MPPPKRAAANDRSITLLPDVDPTELRLGIFGSFNAWPSGDQELIRLLFRVAARMHELTVDHQVSYPTGLNLAPNALPPPYVCMILTLDLKSRYRISNHTPLNFLSEISRALCGRH
jgi:hypothetical protein